MCCRHLPKPSALSWLRAPPPSAALLNTWCAFQVGRAGRFGTKGLAITFVASETDSAVLNSVQVRRSCHWHFTAEYAAQCPAAPTSGLHSPVVCM